MGPLGSDENCLPCSRSGECQRVSCQGREEVPRRKTSVENITEKEYKYEEGYGDKEKKKG